jgi:hypothetical protein
MAHKHRFAPHRGHAWREHYFCAFPGCGLALHGRHLRAALDEGATMATPDDVDQFDAHANDVEAYWKRELGEPWAR